ncbi:MAG: DUF3108 domain-containing protein, partial [Rudaea sp.]
MRAGELAAPRPVLPRMPSFTSPRPRRLVVPSQLRVRPALVVALVLSVALHLAWSLWPVDETPVQEVPVLTATLEEMPAPPPPAPAPPPVAEAEPSPAPVAASRRKPHRAAHPPVIAAPQSLETTPAEVAQPEEPTPVAPVAPVAPETAATPPADAGAASAESVERPPVVLPPRLDLAYKVFLGTRGFMIGDATYRFEHEGNSYRISTVAQARGLAALIVHGKGKVESYGRITEQGLKPYEFAVERGSADRRETAFFDWDAGNVVLHDGRIETLEAPAFDPLTILWQPYFSPPTRDDVTFSLATTRRVARYTLTMEGEETLVWPRGEVLTQRWHRVSDDGKLEAWIWLAPSMHYIPIKMRVTRTSRGTLEVLLDAIRTDADADAVAPPPEDPPAFAPGNPVAPFPNPDNTGQ